MLDRVTMSRRLLARTLRPGIQVLKTLDRVSAWMTRMSRRLPVRTLLQGIQELKMLDRVTMSRRLLVRTLRPGIQVLKMLDRPMRRNSARTKKRMRLTYLGSGNVRNALV